MAYCMVERLEAVIYPKHVIPLRSRHVAEKNCFSGAPSIRYRSCMKSVKNSVMSVGLRGVTSKVEIVRESWSADDLTTTGWTGQIVGSGLTQS